MAYTDDWESLMNGVFGPGGRFKAAPGTPAEPRQQPNSTLNDLNAALLEQQKKLDAMLKAQSAQLKTQDTAAEAALADSRRMLRDMENDGLLAKGTTEVKPEHLGSFEGLADEVKQTVLDRTPLWRVSSGPCAAPSCWAPRHRRPGTSSCCGAAPAPGGTSPLRKRPAAWPPAGC